MEIILGGVWASKSTEMKEREESSGNTHMLRPQRSENPEMSGMISLIPFAMITLLPWNF